MDGEGSQQSTAGASKSSRAFSEQSQQKNSYDTRNKKLNLISAEDPMQNQPTNKPRKRFPIKPMPFEEDRQKQLYYTGYFTYVDPGRKKQKRTCEEPMEFEAEDTAGEQFSGDFTVTTKTDMPNRSYPGKRNKFEHDEHVHCSPDTGIEFEPMTTQEVVKEPKAGIFQQRFEYIVPPDPNPPKAPKSAADFFYSTMKMKTNLVIPANKEYEASNIANEVFQQLTDLQKMKYYFMAKEDQIRFQNELEMKKNLQAHFLDNNRLMSNCNSSEHQLQDSLPF